MQIGIPMFFVYLLYRYRVPALARYKKRCHQLRRVLDTVDRESHGQMDGLATFLNAEASEDRTYEQLPSTVLAHVISYLVLSVAADDASSEGRSLPHGLLLPSGGREIHASSSSNATDVAAALGAQRAAITRQRWSERR